jgi:hypothetical protein
LDFDQFCGFESLAKFPNFGSNFTWICNNILKFRNLTNFVVLRVRWRFPNFCHFPPEFAIKEHIFSIVWNFVVSRVGENFQLFWVNSFRICSVKQKFPIIFRFVVSIVLVIISNVW